MSFCTGSMYEYRSEYYSCIVQLYYRAATCRIQTKIYLFSSEQRAKKMIHAYACAHNQEKKVRGS